MNGIKHIRRATSPRILAGLVLAAFAASSHAGVEEHKVPCTAAQSATIKTAVAEARKSLVAASKSFVSNQPVAKQSKWFGALDSSGADTIKKVYDRALVAAVFSVYWCPVRNDLDFKWEIGDVAAVHSSAPGAMFLTPDFFKMPTSGTDSQQGTIIHELTHIVGIGLHPEHYGVDKAKALAAKDRMTARKNSDNYQYYVEDIIYGIP